MDKIEQVNTDGGVTEIELRRKINELVAAANVGGGDPAAIKAAVAGVGSLLAGNNLSDLASAEDARHNLGLGTAALASVGDFQPSSTDLAAIAALATTEFGRALLTLEAADVVGPLGLGTAALANADDFQPASPALNDVAKLSTTAFGLSLLTQEDSDAATKLLGLQGAVFMPVDADSSLAADSDEKLVTQKAVKSYVDKAVSKATLFGAPSVDMRKPGNLRAGFCVMRSLLCLADGTLTGVGLLGAAVSSATALRPVVYACGEDGEPGALLATGPVITGLAAGHNLAPLADRLAVTKGQIVWVGAQVSGAAAPVPSLLAVADTAYFASGGEPADPAPASVGTQSLAAVYAEME